MTTESGSTDLVSTSNEPDILLPPLQVIHIPYTRAFHRAVALCLEPYNSETDYRREGQRFAEYLWRGNIQADFFTGFFEAIQLL